MTSSSRGGFILVAALWLLVALSAVALDAALRSKARRVPAANILDDGRARQAALAGSEYARSRLTAALSLYNEQLRAETQRAGRQAGRGGNSNSFNFNFNFNSNTAGRGAQRSARSTQSSTSSRSIAQAENPWREPQQLMLGGLALADLQFVLDVQDTGVRLNINVASETMMRQFLSEGMRIDYPTADRVAQAIMDWRDQDTLPRVNGAERDQYIDAGAVMLPTNLRFADVDELRHVMGMTPELLETLRPYITVIGSGRINVNAAPVEVLAALPGFTTSYATQLVRLRDAGNYPASASELRQLLGMSNLTGSSNQEFNSRTSYSTVEVAIVSEGAVADSPVRARVTTIVQSSATAAVVVWQKVE
jgi:type II secretory pathway component PulK